MGTWPAKLLRILCGPIRQGAPLRGAGALAQFYRTECAFGDQRRCPCQRRLGDIDGVHRAVDEAYELLPGTDTPVGVPSSISLDSYSPAQIAGNAATAYLSLAKPDRVEHYAGLALSEMSDANSPWGRSLVMIDVARSHILNDAADLASGYGER